MLALLVAISAASPHGAVAAANPLAAQAGAEVLRRGGNAVDAAVAAAFALAVVEPQSSGLAGGGFALVFTKKDRKVHVLDFRETAPGAARPDLYLVGGQARQDLANAGALAVAVPAAVKGYAELVKRWGTRPLSFVTGPAEQLALHGWQVDEPYHGASEHRLDCLAADDEAARLYLRRDESGEWASLEPGDRRLNPDLARTLRLIGERGPDAFYKGRIGQAIVQAVQSRGGILTADDLARVQVRERAPLESTYRGHRVVSMPLPSAGGFYVLALLNVLERENPGQWHDARFLHVMIEAQKRLFAARERLGDPAFNPGEEERLAKMITKDYAGELHASIGEQATPAAKLVPSPEHGTTPIAVIDEQGNAVALTSTVNDSFGACIVPKGTGFVLNDQMDDFAVAADVPNAYGLMGFGENAPGPGKIPLSSMAPTLVFAPDGDVLLALNAAGGSTIPTSVAEAIQHVVDDRMTVDRAIAAPRVHHNLFPDVVHLEPHGFDDATLRALEARGHKLQVADEALAPGKPGMFAHPWGKACGVELEPATQWRIAACDPRLAPGAAVP